MQKIMFNDRFSLTQAVLEGRKTQTRRRVTPQPYYDEKVGMVWKDYASGRGSSDFGEPQASYRNFVHHSEHKIDEIVAVAQSYENAGIDPYYKIYNKRTKKYDNACDTAGWTNKMFVKPELMPHQIKITNVRLQRLQEITDDECLLEGVKEVEKSNNWGNSATHTEYCVTYYDNKGLTKQLIGRNPKEAYAFLIDALSGKGTWDSNPYVFVYDFELVK